MQDTMTDRSPLYVTRPALPPLDELLPMLEEIWESRMVSNEGDHHQQLERALCDYFGVDHVSLVTNATAGLTLALSRCGEAGEGGEVITTPFTFVGTAHAIRSAGFDPVFADIDPVSLNLDADKIEAAITPNTRAIMPVHIFGRSCDTSAIDQIAARHGLAVIYDAAHAFGVSDDGGSILRHGDMSVLSFHGTKVFNTFEGGAVICRDAETKAAIDLQRNFGIVDEVTVAEIGTNAKMNEFCAALGLVQLRHIDRYIAGRRDVDTRYRKLLNRQPGIKCLQEQAGVAHNHYHFPILVNPEAGCSRDELYNALQAGNIYARRYFFPLVSELPMYSKLPSASPANLPVATTIASRVLCLPQYPELSPEDQRRVTDVIAACTASAASPAALGAR